MTPRSPGGGGCGGAGGERRGSAGRAGVLPPCPGLRCQGEGVAVKLLQGMTQPGCASVLAVGSGRTSAVQKRCVYKRCSAFPWVVYLLLLPRKHMSCAEFSHRFLVVAVVYAFRLFS